MFFSLTRFNRLCTPPNGFVEAIYPSNGATDVPMSINHITIFFNQPMEIGTGGHGVQNIGRYLLQNLSNNDKLDITDVTYDPLTFVAQVYFSKASNWSILTTYQFTIDKEIANDPTCAVKQDVHIQIEFTTDNGSVVIHDNLVLSIPNLNFSAAENPSGNKTFGSFSPNY